MNSYKIIFYAINGTGLGHISRLLNIARELNVISVSLNIKADIKFVTTSEGSQVASQFPVYKLPSMKIQQEFTSTKKELLADNKFFITNLFGVFRPDIAVLDTKPEGAYGEFSLFESYCKKKVFVNRRTSKSTCERAGRSNLINTYDLVLIPDSKDNAEFYPGVDTEKKFVDIIHGFRPESCLTQSEVRSFFNLQEGEKLIYISAGGGGDKNVQEQIDSILSILTDRSDVKILVGYGVLYRGDIQYAKNIIPFTGTEVRKYFNGLDAAISAAGYNTYQELLAAKVPTMFFYQDKGMDEQDVRVFEGEKKGWNHTLHSLTDKEELLSGLDKLFNEGDIIRENLNKRNFAVGSINAAVEILCQLVTKEKSANEYMQLHFVALCLLYWKKGLYKNFSGDFSDYLYWMLKTQPLIMGAKNWQSFIEQCYLHYKQGNHDNKKTLDTILGCFQDCERIIKTHFQFKGTRRDKFSFKIDKFLKKYTIEKLTAINLKNMFS